MSFKFLRLCSFYFLFAGISHSGASPLSDKISNTVTDFVTMGAIPGPVDPPKIHLGDITVRVGENQEKIISAGESEKAYASNTSEQDFKTQFDKFVEKENSDAGSSGIFTNKFSPAPDEIPNDKTKSIYLKASGVAVTQEDLTDAGNQMNFIIRPVVQTRSPDRNPEDHKITAIDVEFFSYRSQTEKKSTKTVIRIIPKQPVNLNKEIVEMMKSIATNTKQKGAGATPTPDKPVTR